MDLRAWVTKGMEKLRSFGIKEWGMVLITGICCLVIVIPTGEKENGTGQKETKEEAVDYVKTQGEEADYVEQMEKRLTELLSSVEGVGSVKVMITAESTVERKVLQDGSQEREQVTEEDSAGGSRNSISERSEGTTVFFDTAGKEGPYILQETYPEITGVVVIAKGSGSGTVDFDIMNAVQVLFNVPAHKIKIMKMK